MKKIFLSLLTFVFIFSLSGCKTDSMDDITIYTTTYPIEYITNELYGANSTINSKITLHMHIFTNSTS